MSKIMIAGFALLSVVFFAYASGNSATQRKQNASEALSGTLQKMIVENGSVTMTVDLNGLNGSDALVTRPMTLQFAAAINSFFPILVFNDQLREPEEGSVQLVAESQAVAVLPARLAASLKHLVLEKLPDNAASDLAVRDASTGFTFFDVDGPQYDYDGKAQLFSITDGRLTISKQFANALGRPSDAGALVGKISVGAAMQPVEVQTIVNGTTKSVVMPRLHEPLDGTAPGPDVIVGELYQIQQMGSAAGTQVGIAVGTISCNAGVEDLDWFALPNIDHPVIPQNFYRMSGGANNNDRFEQIGQSWLKHAFTALTNNDCNYGCNGVGGPHLGSGCSDPYSASLNGNQSGIGSRAWVNPFTGAFPSTANNHSGHAHDGVSHRVRIEVDDLNQNLNQGATYFAEAQYVTPHEYAWCQAHPAECNMFNNASHRPVSVTGTAPPFGFSFTGPTVRTRPAILAWTGASATQWEPDPGNDGIYFVSYKVTNPTAGVWHYEYALYNENLDRGIQSFSVPLGPGINVSNVGFHAPPQEPGWTNDGTQNNEGYSSKIWDHIQTGDSITWSTDTFAQNQNANAIRWGTMYNFRFDADQPPQATNATVGFFKTGSPMAVDIQGPAGGSPTPTPTATATPTATPSPTATATPRPTPTARPNPSVRPRPTPLPRPAPPR